MVDVGIGYVCRWDHYVRDADVERFQEARPGSADRVRDEGWMNP